MIHVAYCINDKNGTYCRLLGTSVCSLLENTNSDLTLHIVHDNTLSEDNIEKLKSLVERYDKKLLFYNLDSMNEEKYLDILTKIDNTDNSRITVGTFYRLLLPFVLPCDLSKVIYIDCDTIVHINIEKLWSVEIEGYPLGAVPEYEATRGCDVRQHLCDIGIVEKSDYFNAGVLLLNLKFLRNEDHVISDGIELLNNDPQCKYKDQDILNYFYSKLYLKLPINLNVFVGLPQFAEFDKQNYEALRHYAGNSATLFPQSNYNNFLFFSYFSKTPWFTASYILWTLLRLEVLISDKKNAFVKFVQYMKKKEVVLYYHTYFKESIDKYFNLIAFYSTKELNDNMIALSDELRQEIKNNINEGKLLVFFSPRSFFEQIRIYCNENKSIEGEDFFYGVDLIPEANLFQQSMYIPYL